MWTSRTCALLHARAGSSMHARHSRRAAKKAEHPESLAKRMAAVALKRQRSSNLSSRATQWGPHLAAPIASRDRLWVMGLRSAHRCPPLPTSPPNVHARGGGARLLPGECAREGTATDNRRPSTSTDRIALTPKAPPWALSLLHAKSLPWSLSASCQPSDFVFFRRRLTLSSSRRLSTLSSFAVD